MPNERKSSKIKTRKLPKEALLLSEKPINEQIGYLCAIVENMDNRVKMIAEGHSVLNEKMDVLGQKVDGLERRFDGLEQKVDVLEMAVRNNSQQIQTLDKRVETLDKRVETLDKKVDSVRDELKRDILRVEAKLDPVIEKVERHDKDIAVLKSAAVFPT